MGVKIRQDHLRIVSLTKRKRQRKAIPLTIAAMMAMQRRKAKATRLMQRKARKKMAAMIAAARKQRKVMPAIAIVRRKMPQTKKTRIRKRAKEVIVKRRRRLTKKLMLRRRRARQVRNRVRLLRIVMTAIHLELLSSHDRALLWHVTGKVACGLETLSAVRAAIFGHLAVFLIPEFAASRAK